MSTLGTSNRRSRWGIALPGALVGRALVPEILLVGLLVAGAAAVVYATGGSAFSFVHVAYLPILVAGYFFGLPGGVLAGLMAGIALGPFMPLDVEAGSSQTTLNWVVRTIMFTGVGAVAGLLASLLRRQLEAAKRFGFHDPLTQLPNRAQLVEDLTGRLGRPRPAEPLAVVTVGIGSFPSIQSAFGDRLAAALRQADVVRLKERLPSGAVLYDLGGARFAVTADAEPDLLAAALVDTLTEQVVIEGIPLLGTAHAGIASYPEDDTSAEGLVRASVSAFRDAIELDQPRVRFDQSHDLARRDALRLVADFQSALRSADQLMLAYQPKVDLETGSCAGVEALVRWQHPERGLLMPGRFIELVERTALIQPFTIEVIRLAVRQLLEWAARDVALTIAVNVSTRNLLDPAFADFVARELADSVLASKLQFEVTETSLMTAREEANRALRSFRDMGVKVALDDFGTGHSSLAYLRDLAVNEIKLDRSFLQNLVSDRRARVMVENTIRVAHELGLRVVAEGIEDAATYEYLRNAGCDLGQGFLIARPLPAAEVEQWLAGRAGMISGVSTLSTAPFVRAGLSGR